MDTEYCPCEVSYPNHSGERSDTFTYNWDEGMYLVGDLDGQIVSWRATDYTPDDPEAVDIVHVWVNDNADIPDECDTGSRNDLTTLASISLGAWKTKAKLIVSGTNMSVPQNVVIYDTDCWNFAEDIPGTVTYKHIDISIDSSTISLGNYNDDSVVTGTEALGMITSQANWTMSCVPVDMWNADEDGTVFCRVDRIINGEIISRVWDEDDDSNSVMSADVQVTFPTPFPVSIGITPHFHFDDVEDCRSQVCVGFGYKSDTAFGDVGFQGTKEHEDDSNAHHYLIGTPHTKTTNISDSSSPQIWPVDTASGVLSSMMKTQTEGWIKAVERAEIVPYGTMYWDMRVEAWQDGTVRYSVGEPSYEGTPHDNESW